MFFSLSVTAQEHEIGLLGNWSGQKEKLSSRGIDLEAAYKLDFVHNASGGLKRGSVLLGNLDLKANFDLEKIIHFSGTSLKIYGLGNHGQDPTEWIGDSFAASNIEAPDTFKLYELLLNRIFSETLSVSLGLTDLNAIYYVTDSSGDFINSAFGISPSLSQTGVNGPSIFPQASLALNISLIHNSYYVNAGVFNARAGDPDKAYGTQIYSGDAEGYLTIVELGHQIENSHKYSVGLWSYSKEVDKVDESGLQDANNGFYVLFDQQLNQHFSFFTRFGVAKESVNTFSSSLESGILVNGVLPGRESDVLGIGFAHAQASSDYRSANSSEQSESVIELYYQAQITKGLTLSPDLQLVMNPGLSQTLKDSQVYGLRLNLIF